MVNEQATTGSFRRAYSEAIEILRPFDGICPRDCNLCEERETLVLVPGESRLIPTALTDVPDQRRRLLQVLDASDSSNEACKLQCSTCNSCRIYASRPVDCRSFPAVPDFDLKGNDVRVNVSRSYCPIADELPAGFVEAVRCAWQVLSPFLTTEWKKRFNETPSNP